MDHIWKSIQIGDGAKWNTTWNNNSAYMYEASPTSQKPIFIKLEFEEKISPEEVNEIQFLTNDPYIPTIESNSITKLGDTFVFERTDPDAMGLRAPKNPRKATDIYVYQIKNCLLYTSRCV